MIALSLSHSRRLTLTLCTAFLGLVMTTANAQEIAVLKVQRRGRLVRKPYLITQFNSFLQCEYWYGNHGKTRDRRSR